jgi:hypothetical protein
MDRQLARRNPASVAVATATFSTRYLNRYAGLVPCERISAIRHAPPDGAPMTLMMVNFD